MTNAVMSQEEIDAVLNSIGPAPAPPAPPAASPPPPDPVVETPAVGPPTGFSPPPATVSQPVVLPVAQGASAEEFAALSQKVERLEAAIKKLTEIDSDKLMAAVQLIEGNLNATPSYGAANTFQCKKCQTKGMVAMPFMCTHCGERTWLGWWPPKQ